MAKILIIDDDEDLCGLLSIKFQKMEHEVDCALTLEDGCRKVVSGSFDVVYLDVRLPDGNGLDKLQIIGKAVSAPLVIIMTGQGDPDGADLAIKNGAWDYIKKPSSLNSMALPLIRALEYREIKIAQKPAIALKREGIIGSSWHMQCFLDQLAQAASTDIRVLISGETGVGKELAARAIHKNSHRAKQNFVVVDCAALSETLVEGTLFGHEKGAYTGAEKAQDGYIKQADGGTLFLMRWVSCHCRFSGLFCGSYRSTLIARWAVSKMSAAISGSWPPQIVILMLWWRAASSAVTSSIVFGLSKLRCQRYGIASRIFLNWPSIMQ